MLLTTAEFERVDLARQNPNRRDAEYPLDPRLESLLGRMRVKNRITESEYQAGVKWRNSYTSYIHSIERPDDLTDDECENASEAYHRGIKILEAKGKRVLHAVNSIAVFEDPEELGDFEYTLKAAQIGLAALATSF